MFKKASKVLVLFSLSIAIANCDTLKPTIRGSISYGGAEIEHPVNKKPAITGAIITIECPGITRRTQEVMSDSNGRYVLNAVGHVEDCALTIVHPDFQRQVIKINKIHLIEERYGLSPVYEVDVKMEPIR